jgi:hydrogenase-4 component F
MLIFVILGIPLLLALVAMVLRNQKALGVTNSIGYAAIFTAAIFLLKNVVVTQRPVVVFGFIYLDALSAFFIFVIAVVGLAAALYSISYIQRDVAAGVISARKAGMYYVLFNLFCFSMFFVPSVNNLGMLWVGIEMTTLISAFLVGFYNNKKSVEAAWKYIIICSVGIILALLGTILFSYAFSQAGGAKSLNWSDMMAAAARMDKNILKVAFIFILVGYGTKAGLAPMHTWLPDAHSQAVAPTSALLSGVLLKTAVYAILRFGAIVVKAIGFSYFAHLMILLGLVSLAISCGFILVQKDLKRLLAYSSIEHIGLIAVGFGLGAPLAAAGALFHIYNHAVTKSLLFFGAGHIVSAYERHNMRSIRGVLKALPFAGTMVLLGMFALTGFPPFSIFVSEIVILIAAFTQGSYVVAGLVLLFLAVVFGAFVFHFGEMLFGHLPKGQPVSGEPLSGKLAFLFLFIQICGAGAAFLFFKKDFLWIAQSLFQG